MGQYGRSGETFRRLLPTRRLIALGVGGVTAAAWLILQVLKRSRKRIAFYTSDTISLLEERIQRDEGKRGIRPLVIPGDLEAAARLLVQSKKVAILTGFPCMVKHTPPTETDGPPGAFAIARACIALGHIVYVLTDECNEEVLIAAAANTGLPGSHLKLESFPPKAKWGEQENRRLKEIASEVDAVVALERTGPGQDGSYYTMRAICMDHLVAPLDRLFSMGKPTVGIGDGGNELGMGKVVDRVRHSSIPNAQTIGCVVAADYLIVASVSNWGGYALAGAMALVAAQEGLFASRVEAVDKSVVTEAQETSLLDRIVEAGARDGITGELRAWVDGMPLEASMAVIRAVRNIAKAGAWWW